MSILKSIIYLSVLILTSCSLSPGLHIEADTINDSWFKVNEGKLEYKIERINRELISKLSVTNDEVEGVDYNSIKIKESDHSYFVGRGDVLLITVFEHPQLTMPGGPNNHPETSGTVVKNNGEIFVPYVGNISAVGKTTSSIREEIQEKLSKYVNNPQVDVRVVKFQSKKIIVGGEVKVPGVIPITNTPLNILQAISKSEGLTPNADETRAVLTREGVKTQIDLNLFYTGKESIKDYNLKDGDSIYIADKNSKRVFVLGEVNRAKPIAMTRDGLSLTDAIGRAGGLNQRFSNAKGVFVIREQSLSKPITVYQLDASKPYSLILGSKFMLKDKDVVFVTPSNVTRWNRVISQLLPTATLIQRASNTNE